MEAKREHLPRNSEERLAAYKQIVAEGTYAKIDECLVGYYTALIVVQVHDSLNAENRKTLMSFQAQRVNELAFKVAGVL